MEPNQKNWILTTDYLLKFQKYYGFAFGLDISQKVALFAYNCIKSEKYSSVFIRAYIPKNEGMVDSNYTQNIYNAQEG